MNETPHSVGKAGICCRIWVIVQALMLIAATTLFILAPTDGDPTVRMHKANADIRGGLATALEMFEIDCGRYPTTSEGLNILVTAPTDGSLTNYRGPYLDNIPRDSWSHAYVYRFPAVHSAKAFDLYSLGRDGVSKSGGNDPDDIANWEKPWSRGFSGDDFMCVGRLLLLLILLLYVIRVVAAAVSLRFSVFVYQNRGIDRIWTAIAAIVFVIILILLLMPKIAGRAE